MRQGGYKRRLGPKEFPAVVVLRRKTTIWIINQVRLVVVDKFFINQSTDMGEVISVRGSVVDVSFRRQLPALYSVLHTGDNSDIVIEVVNHLDSRTVPGIALTSTRGLAVGANVVDTGAPLKAPVGDKIRGRVFNVFGQTIDGKGDIDGCAWRSIHRELCPLESSGYLIRGLRNRNQDN